MKMFKRFFALLLTTNLVFADDPDQPGILATRDTPELYNWLVSKRSIPLYEKFLEALKFSGDVRFDAKNRQEWERGRKLRGGDAVDPAGLPVPLNNYDVELNLYVNYKCARSYGQIYINYDNACGVQESDCGCDFVEATEIPKRGPLQRMFGSGFCDDLCLKRAWYGLNVYKDEELKVDIELGRRPMYTVFDSRIQFKNRMDGVVVKVSDVYAHYSDERASDFYVTVASFIVDSRVGHYAWAGESGVYNIADSGFDFKFSVVDWGYVERNRFAQIDPQGIRYTNLQFTGAYNFYKQTFGRPVRLYGAFLTNIMAQNVNRLIENAGFTTDNDDLGLQNLGAYLGFIIGDARKQGEWSLDVNWQYVQAQAVPDGDVRGIGRGNFNKGSFYCDWGGNPNYTGVSVDFLYALTDKCSLDFSFDESYAANAFTLERKSDHKIFGGSHRYRKFEIDLIHTF